MIDGNAPAATDTSSKNSKWPLWLVVVVGFLASCIALFLASWYFSYQATLTKPAWEGVPPLTQQQMFGVIRNALTTVAALGVGVTLFLSYRRQHVAERTLELSAEAQVQAAKTLDLSVRTFDLSRQQHELDYQNQLRTRYSTAAQQIGEENASLAIAGCISMASIADEWNGLGKWSDRDDCVRMLVAALPQGSWADAGNHLRRSTIQSIFQEHMTRPDEDDPRSWAEADIDFRANRAPFGRIAGWTIYGSIHINSDQLSQSNGTAVIQSTTITSALLHVLMNATWSDFLLLTHLTLKHATLHIEFGLLPAQGEPSRLVFRETTFTSSTLRVDEPNSPCLPRTVVFERCTFHNRTIQVPRNSSAYKFVFISCTFAANPFKTVNKTRSPNVGIELRERNVFTDAMEGFPEDRSDAILDTSSWFFPTGKPSRSRNAADGR